MNDSGSSSSWRDGDSYELYVGRWSRKVTASFVSWLEVAPKSRWLDVGCGTGALSSAVLERCDPAVVFGVEPSEGFLQTAARYFGDRATLVHGAAESIPLSDESFDAVVSGLVLNFVADQQAALAEMSRVAAPGATIAAYLWDYGGGMQFMKYFWEAAAGLDGAADFDERARFPICNPDALARALQRFRFSGANRQGNRHPDPLLKLQRLLATIPRRYRRGPGLPGDPRRRVPAQAQRAAPPEPPNRA